jgi:hypothetical protein
VLGKKPDAMVVVVALLTSTLRRLKEDLAVAYPDKEIGFYSGTMKDPAERARQLDLQIVVTNDKMMKEGNDCPVEVIINTIPMSSEVGLEQLIGRLRGGEGRKAVYVDVTDVGFSKSREQFNRRKKFIDSKIARQFAVKELSGEEWVWEGMPRKFSPLKLRATKN